MEVLEMDKETIKKGKMKMGENSSIAWTDHTFNPWVGCFKVSEGCKNCYAETQMTRKPRWANTWGPPALTERLKTSESNWNKPLKWNRNIFVECVCGWRGFAFMLEGYRKQKCPSCERTDLTHKVRQRVFCSSLADVFEDNPQVEKWRELLWNLIDSTPNLDWLLLTKRPENILKLSHPIFWDNIWIGTSVENQAMADKRIPELCQAPAKIRFLSVEPMLEKMDIEWPTPCGYYCDDRVGHVDHSLAGHIHWVIVGGESGSSHRPFNWGWARGIRDQCKKSNVAFFMKQGAGKSQAHMPEIPTDLMIREFPQ